MISFSGPVARSSQPAADRSSRKKRSRHISCEWTWRKEDWERLGLRETDDGDRCLERNVWVTIEPEVLLDVRDGVVRCVLEGLVLSRLDDRCYAVPPRHRRWLTTPETCRGLPLAPPGGGGQATASGDAAAVGDVKAQTLIAEEPLPP